MKGYRRSEGKLIEQHLSEKSRLAPVKNEDKSSSSKSDKQAPIEISKSGGRLNISISIDHIQTTPNFDIVKMISLAISPIFTNQNKPQIQKQVKKSKITGFQHVAFFIEDMGHYTGGRYSYWLQAVILSQYTQVTIVSNAMPIFYNDFNDYHNDNFTFIQNKNYCLDTDANEFDIIVGLPNISGQFATDYAEKYGLPLYLVIFETPNWIIEYRDGVDADDDFWQSYKKCMKRASAILVPSKESSYWLKEWDAAFLDKPVHVIYPCMNELVAMKTVPRRRRHFQIVFTSRMAPFKNPISIFKKLPKDIKIIMIGKVWADDLKMINKLVEDGHDIEVYKSVNDEIKFKTIAESSLVVHPSKFEGFGMPPMEGLYFGKPVVVFDLPVLREVYGNDINYVELGNRRAFLQKILEIRRNPTKFTSFNNNPSGFHHISTNLRTQKEIFNMPKISFGVLAFNCGDYLESAIKSIYNLAHQIIIVVGAVKGYSNKQGSIDNTDAVISKLVADDYYQKITVVEKKKTFWVDKVAMQNAIAKRVTGDFYIKMDSDEIWKPKTIMKVIDIMLNNPDIMVIKMPFFHFWTSFDKIAVDAGGKWSTKHPRIWRWKKSYRHRKSFNHFIDTDNDNRAVVSPYVEEHVYGGDGIYHMGYCKIEGFIKQKLKYYKNRNIEKIVVDTYTPWKKMSDPTQPTQKVRSWVEKFTGELPEVLKKHPYFGIEDVRKEIVRNDTT